MSTVFISHSANGDVFADAVLDRLHILLEAKNYKVLVDRTGLRVAHDYEDELEQWASCCDAAVVLLNAKALTSDWVRDEVAVLLNRRTRQRLGRMQQLMVVPVLLGGVQPGHVRSAGFRKLAKLEYLDGSAERDAFVLAERIAGEFSAGRLEDAAEDAMSDWIRRIAYQLSQVADEGQLVEAARALEMDEDEIGNVRLWGGAQFLAERLVNSHLCSRTVSAAAKLIPFMSADNRRMLVDEIKPTWVDGEAAGLILRASPSERLVALLNARWHQTGEEYFARATCRAKPGYWSCVVGGAVGAQPVEELLIACENALEAGFVVDVRDNPANQVPKKGRYFLIIDPSGVRLEVVAGAIRTLNQRFPWLGILLLTGESLPDGAVVKAWQLPNTVALLPELVDSTEFTARQMVRDLINLVAQS